MRVLVDTNVLVSFLTDRDAAQQERAAALLAEAAAGRLVLALHQMVVMELVYVLTNLYRVAPREVAATLGDLFAMPGVETVEDLPWARLLDLWPTRVPDFADAALAASAAPLRCDRLATFDRDFAARARGLGMETYW